MVITKEDLAIIDGFYQEYKENEYKLYSLQLEKDDQVILNNEVLFNQVVSDGMKKYMLDDTYLRTDVKIETPSNEYSIYTQFPTLKCSFYNCDLGEFVIEVNGHEYEMKSFPHLLIDEKSETLKKYEFDLESDILKFGQLYTFNIRKKSENKAIFVTKFIVIKSLDYEFDHEFYYREKMAQITAIEVEGITILEQLAISKDIRFTNEVKIDALTSDNLKVKLVIEVPKLSWTLSKEFNSQQESSYLLADELYKNNELSLNVPYEEYHLIAIGKSGIKFIESQGRGCYCIDNLKNLEEDYVTIGLLIPENSLQIPLFEIWYHPTLKNIILEYFSDDQSKLQIDYEQVGEFIGTVRIYDSQNQLISEGTIDRNKPHHLLLDVSVSKERCLVQVIQQLEDEFGFNSEEITIFETSFFTGDDLLSAVKDDVLEVNLCDIDGTCKGVNNFYLTDFQIIREGVDYQAVAFYKKERAGTIVWQKLDDKINPINLHVLGRQQNKLQFTLTDNAGDGFVYHKDTKKLVYLNTKDYESYDYPDFYLLDLSKS